MNPKNQLRMLNLRVRSAQAWADALWRLRHDGSDFSIISDNCWGGFLYQHLRRPYLTPFAGLFMEPDCFLRMLADLRSCLAHPPRRAAASRYGHLEQARGRLFPEYPIGLLGDGIEVHFLHYATWEEALAKWLRRRDRIRWDRLYFKFTDRDGADPDLARRFLALPFPRKLYLTNRADVAGNEVVCLGGRGAPTVHEGTWEFRRHMDVPAWLSAERVRGGAWLQKLGAAADAHLAEQAARRDQVRLAAGGAPASTPDQVLAHEPERREPTAC